MTPGWLTTLAWVSLSMCLACATVIGWDIVAGQRRQPMGVMNLVFPITALYFGPAALWFYWRWCRAPARRPAGADGAYASDSRQHDHAAPRPGWVAMAIEVSHCGSGCTLGDIIAELIIFWTALTIAGVTLYAEFAGDFLMALILGIAFQYFAIAPMRGLGLADGLKAAAKADVISLTAFEIGLLGWMAIFMLVLFPSPQPAPDTAAFWFLMQIGMMTGFATSWPANVWLVRRGVKVPM
jgi:hypothetical protein